MFSNWGGFITGAALFTLMLVLNPFRVDVLACRTLAIAVLMITWWITEAMPMPAVALLPLVLFPLMNVTSLKETSVNYGDSILFLFLGGFMIGLAIEKWKLHKRIALSIVNVTGTSGDRIILGFILATGLLSMWLSNTATTMMMFPIAASVIHVVKENREGHGNIANFSLVIMLSIAYASNFGGIATIIGTPPNVAFVGYIKEKYGYTIQFVDWLIICAPIAVLLLLALYLVTTKLMYPNRLKSDAVTRELIETELRNLGPMSVAEKRVLAIFTITAVLWITKDIINTLNLIRLDDTMIALMGALTLFVVPSGMDSGGRLLEWPDTSRIAWGIILLFGGGLALAAALEKAGLIQTLGTNIAEFAGSGGLVLVLSITIVAMFVSEVMSNIAQVIVFSPVIGGIADAMQINPLLLGIPMTLAASCASMMPMGTPPNAIVFASGHIRLKQMVLTGLVMNIVGIILITLFCWYVIPLLVPQVR